MTETQIRDADAVLAALDRAKNDAKTYREQLEEAQAELAGIKEQLTEQTNALKDIRLRRYITEQGADPDRVMKYIKTDDLTLTKDGLEGFEDEFKRVKEDLPELFDPKRRVGGAVEMHPESDANHVKSVSEMQAAKLLRNY